MQLIVVCYSYAPAVTPRAIRWAAVCEELVRLDHQVTVLAGTIPGQADEETLNGVRVIRVGELGIDLLRERWRTPSAAGVADSHGQGVLRRIHDAAWKRIYWPDANCLWYPRAVRAGNTLLRAQPEATLLTVSLPFVGHLVGLRLKRRDTGRRWLVDIGDPFAFSLTPTANDKLYRRLNHAVERRVLAKADMITVTNRAAADRYADTFPEARGKLRVIPPLAAPPLGGRPVFDPSTEKIRFVFAGTFYSVIRSPDRLLTVIDAFARNSHLPVELHLLGDMRECAPMIAARSHQSKTTIVIHGMVSRADTFATLQAADILINVGNAVAFQLPSKIVEYAITGRPILNIIPSEADPSVDVLADYPLVEHVYTNPERAADEWPRVQALVERGRSSGASVAAEKYAARFSGQAIGAQYATALKAT